MINERTILDKIQLKMEDFEMSFSSSSNDQSRSRSPNFRQMEVSPWIKIDI